MTTDYQFVAGMINDVEELKILLSPYGSPKDIVSS
jgi:hypothetical protein